MIEMLDKQYQHWVQYLIGRFLHMSYKESEWIKLENIFSGGYVDNTPSFTLADNLSPFLRNARLEWKATKIRPWHNLFSIFPWEAIILSDISSVWVNVENLRNWWITSLWETFTTGTDFWFLSAVDFFGFKFGTPTGNIVAKLYAVTWVVWSTAIPTWAALATSDNVDIATLPDITGKDWINFLFSTPFSLVDNTDYAIVVEYNWWDASNFLRISVTQTSTFVGNGVDFQSAAWTTFLDDINFRLYTIVDGQATSWKALGLWSYLRTIASNDRLLMRFDVYAWWVKLITYDTAWTLTLIITGTDIVSLNRMFFQNIWDVIYCLNGGDDFGKLDWITYTTPSTWITNFAPAFSADFSSSHWASGWSVNPNTVYKSVWNDYEDFNSAWSDTFEFEEQIRSLTSNDKTLLVFTPNSISTIDLWDFDSTNGRVTYNTSKLQTREGTNTNATTVTVWVNTYFFTSNKKISRVVRGNNLLWFEVLELSERKYKGISTIMTTLDDTQDDAFGYYVPKDNLIKWFFKTEGSSINNLCIVYDIEKDAFLIDEQKFFFAWVNFKNKNYTISTVEPKIYEDEINQDDEDAWIPFEYLTKEFTVWDPTRKKILWETRAFVKINELAVLTQEILIDGSVVDTKIIDKNNIQVQIWWIWSAPIWSFAIWSWWWASWIDELQEVVILRTKWNLNTIWKKIQFRYTCDTLAWKVQLENLQMRLEIKPELANNLTL